MRRYDRSGFLTLLPDLLDQQVYQPVDGEIVGRSMREIIEEQRSAPDLSGDGSFALEQLELERIDDEWRLARADLEQ